MVISYPYHGTEPISWIVQLRARARAMAHKISPWVGGARAGWGSQASAQNGIFFRGGERGNESRVPEAEDDPHLAYNTHLSKLVRGYRLYRGTPKGFLIGKKLMFSLICVT